MQNNSGLDVGSNLDFSSFKINATQSGDTVTVNATANTTVVGANKGFIITITVPKNTVIEGCRAEVCTDR